MSTSESAPQVRQVERPITAQRPARNLSTDQRTQATTYNIAREVHTQHFNSSNESTAQLDLAINTLQQTTQERFIRGLNVQIKNTTTPESEPPQPLNEVLDSYRQNGNTSERRVLINDLNQLSDEALLAQATTLTSTEIENLTHALRQGTINQFIRTLPPNSPIRETLDLLHVSDQQLRRLIVEMKTHTNADVAAAFNDGATERAINTMIDRQVQTTRNRLFETMRDQAVEANLDRELRALGNENPIHPTAEAHIIHFDHQGQTYNLNIETGTLHRLDVGHHQREVADITQLPLPIRQVILAVRPTPEAAELNVDNVLTLAGIPPIVAGNRVNRQILQAVLNHNRPNTPADLQALYNRLHEIVMTEGIRDEQIMQQATTELTRNITDPHGLTRFDLPVRQELMRAQGDIAAQITVENARNNMENFFVLAGVPQHNHDILNRHVLVELLHTRFNNPPPPTQEELQTLYRTIRNNVLRATDDHEIAREAAPRLVHDVTNLTGIALPARQELMPLQDEHLLQQGLTEQNLLERAGVGTRVQPGDLITRDVLQQLIDENHPTNLNHLLTQLRRIVQTQLIDDPRTQDGILQAETDMHDAVARGLLTHITNPDGLTNFDLPVRRLLLNMQGLFTERQIRDIANNQRTVILIRAGVQRTILENAWRQQPLPAYQQEGAELQNLLGMLTEAELQTLQTNARIAATDARNQTDQAIASAVVLELRTLLNNHRPEPKPKPAPRPTTPPRPDSKSYATVPVPDVVIPQPINIPRVPTQPIDIPQYLFEEVNPIPGRSLQEAQADYMAHMLEFIEEAPSTTIVTRLEATLRIVQQLDPAQFQGWAIGLDTTNPDQIRITNTIRGEFYITPLGITRNGRLLSASEAREAEIPPLMQRELHEYFTRMNTLYRSIGRQLALDPRKNLPFVINDIQRVVEYDIVQEARGSDIFILIPTQGVQLQINGTNLYVNGVPVRTEDIRNIPNMHPALRFALEQYFTPLGTRNIQRPPHAPDLFAVGTKNELLIQMEQQRERLQIGSREMSVREAQQQLRELWTRTTRRYPYPRGHHPTPVHEFIYAVGQIHDTQEMDNLMTQFQQLTDSLAEYNAYFIPQALGIRPRSHGLADEDRFSAHIREANEQFLYHAMTGRRSYNRQASQAIRNALIVAYQNAGEYRKTYGEDLFVVQTQNIPAFRLLRTATIDNIIPPEFALHWMYQYHEIRQAYGSQVDRMLAPTTRVDIDAKGNPIWILPSGDRIPRIFNYLSEDLTPTATQRILSAIGGIFRPNRNNSPTQETNNPVSPVAYESAADHPIQSTLIPTDVSAPRLDLMTATAPAVVAIPEIQAQPVLSEIDQAIRIAEFRYSLQYAQSKGDLLYTVFLLQTTDHPELRNYYIQQIQRILRNTGILTNETRESLSNHYRILIGNEAFTPEGLKDELALLLDNSNMLSFEGYYELKDNDFIQELTNTTRPQNQRWHQRLLNPLQDLQREGTIRKSLPSAKENAIKMESSSFQSMAGVETVDMGDIAMLQNLILQNFQIINANTRNNFRTELDAVLDTPDALRFLQQLSPNDRLLFLSSMFGRAIPQQV